MCTKASRTLVFLRRNLYQCPQDVKEAVYRGLVRPILEYGSCVWDPQGVVLQQEIEKVQNRAARFVTSNYSFKIGSMIGILAKLKWESLKKRRRDSRLILLYKGLKGAACIPTDDLIPPIRRSRNRHSLTFQTPATRTDIYKGSFFPRPRWLGCAVRLETRRSRVQLPPRSATFFRGDWSWATVILSLPLIQEGQLSVSGERMVHNTG